MDGWMMCYQQPVSVCKYGRNLGCNCPRTFYYWTQCWKQSPPENLDFPALIVPGSPVEPPNFWFPTNLKGKQFFNPAALIDVVDSETNQIPEHLFCFFHNESVVVFWGDKSQFLEIFSCVDPLMLVESVCVCVCVRACACACVFVIIISKSQNWIRPLMRTSIHQYLRSPLRQVVL